LDPQLKSYISLSLINFITTKWALIENVVFKLYATKILFWKPPPPIRDTPIHLNFYFLLIAFFIGIPFPMVELSG